MWSSQIDNFMKFLPHHWWYKISTTQSGLQRFRIAIKGKLSISYYIVSLTINPTETSYSDLQRVLDFFMYSPSTLLYIISAIWWSTDKNRASYGGRNSEQGLRWDKLLLHCFMGEPLAKLAIPVEYNVIIRINGQE